MSRMADLHIDITEALDRGEVPTDIAKDMDVPILFVRAVLADITE